MRATQSSTYRRATDSSCTRGLMDRPPGLSRNASDFHDLALALAGDVERPRRVLALDYRGRGRSDYDPDWRNYDIKVELGDVLQVLTATGVEEAVFVGTSRGGISTMALSAA